MASNSATQRHQPLTVYAIRDPAHGAPIRSLPQSTLAIVSLSTDEDGKLAISNSIEGTTTLWDLQTGAELATFQSYAERNGKTGEPCGSFDFGLGLKSNI